MSALRTTPEAVPAPGPEPEAPADLIGRARASYRELARLVAERAMAESEASRAFARGDQGADLDRSEKRATLESRYRSRLAEVDRVDEGRRRGAADLAISGEAEAVAEFGRLSRKIAADFDAAREKARAEHARARNRITAEGEAADKAAVARFVHDRKPVDDALRIAQAMQGRLDALYADYAHFGLPEPPDVPSRGAYKPGDPADRVFDRLHKGEAELTFLEKLAIPRLMRGRRNLWVYLVPAGVLAGPFALGLGVAAGLPLALGVAGAGGFALRRQLYAVSARQVGRGFYPLSQALVDARAHLADLLAALEKAQKDERKAAATAREEALAAAKKEQARAVAEAEAARDEQLRRINEVYARSKVDIQTRLAQAMRDALESHGRHRAEADAKYQDTARRLEEAYQARKAEVRAAFDAARLDLATRWREGMSRVLDDVRADASSLEAINPPWDGPNGSGVPPVVRLGRLRVELAKLPGGPPTDPSLAEGLPESVELPALIPFPARANLLVEAPPAGRLAALGMVRLAMARLLASLPPGRVRFEIVNPVGIGRTFGAFLALADFDEGLVPGPVATDPRQVEERLVGLTEHMEKVAQKYLRDEYATIDEYNAVAEEVAEPYRVLVLADFPAGFDEKCAARLAGLLASGPPCGVLTLIARDLARPLPDGITAEALHANATALAWDEARAAFPWPDPELAPLAFEPDEAPGGEAASAMIRRIGAAARDARRVEVPFEFIAPPRDRWWSKDARSGVDVPLGKAGATKRQDLALGRGTSQHALVAGRTGSGKSTLLHALIVNLALNYGPDEVELYLIDFKKGVEFKVYATFGLPHAAVVAIESEREFGISVLQRLDAEMVARAERFRDAGVADLPGYRNVPGTPPMPRILLVVDEFQEFFVEEDKLAQEAALLLDRLVRQGRAFGVHLHLGSQSLGGAYALARTTLGQFAVRIALQCSEADAHLILSEQNPAARLLSRPGEAIYNDANGAPEGNHFFQVVWLGDDRREWYLRQLRDLAAERPPARKRPAIVFEGDARADLAASPKLGPILEAPTYATSPRSAPAWLGEPIAIQDPTAVNFRRQGGSHLLIVGQDPEAALGIMASALVSLAAQYPPTRPDGGRYGARFALLDGTPEDDPHADRLGRVASGWPHGVDVGTWRDSARVVGEFAAEVARRQEPGAPDGPEMFLLIHDLGRFRDLRRRENDFGFGSPGEATDPTDQLQLILKEGPALGVHLLAWADNLANLGRAFDNQAVREFEAKVLFQMSANDSAHLLDAPTASKLGKNRALLSSEDQNRLEKFRPYALPPDEWLARVAETLNRKAGG